MCSAKEFGNVLSKVQLKLGGVCHKTDENSNRHNAVRRLVGTDDSCLVIGCDVTHPRAEANEDPSSTPSVCAVLGNIGNDLTKFPLLDVRPLPPFTEVIPNFDSIIENLLEARRKYQNQIPNRVVFLRDGVSDSQFDAVLKGEVEAIERAFKNKGEPKPKILVIVTQKRHHIRFFQDGENLPPGTILRGELTHPCPYPNFWLLSHAGIKGTSHPARYFILRNDMGIQEEHISHFCHELCYLYGRCQRAVSYPNATYYAHWLAERGKVLVQDMLTDYKCSMPRGGGGGRAGRQMLTERITSIEECLRERLPTLTQQLESEAMFFL
eukprot:GHVO01057057.1.p1 GENE.GHVO01057057.1~~GHVO01057057.1.p1  ORF type:complete len:324 (-),score=38.31 GHVO01057057.1:75-1046(-)